jgi:hypothetical protein
MTHRIAIMILAGSCLPLAALPPQAPPPKLIDIYRAKSDPELPPLPSGYSYTVHSFVFSPDEQWIAVALRPRAMQAGVTPITGNLDSILLLLPLHPADHRRVEIDPGPPGFEGAGPSEAVLWSPDSQSVVVHASLGTGQGAPKIYNLRGELIGTGPQSGPLIGFIAPGLLLARHPGKLTGFDTVDIRTAAITPWRAPRHWKFPAIDPERGLLAVLPDAESLKTLIVDSATGKVVQSMNNQNQVTVVFVGAYGSSSPELSFAENGKTLCEAELVGVFKSHPVCRDVDTGKTIAEFDGLDGGAPSSASARGSRMVLSRLNFMPGGIRGPERAETYSGHVVWDFRSGTEVAAWRPSTQRTAWLHALGGAGLPAPSVAISPLGNYVAEVFGDELHLYQIP